MEREEVSDVIGERLLQDIHMLGTPLVASQRREH